jgi:CRP/FNR family cyclic AMP-dependent transcriptional regulator
MVSRIMKDLERGGYLSVERKSILIRRKLPPSW